ncbi:hypothetical protein B0I33_10621 [Prauserella shujinwangii]|uniref:WXG100 family type VII secretion target n=1 Tax=Prauserella shujinwangii TaxID=1453103 RepID=A0A2T0LTA4_9PSEU|nr:hypothetical protein [Prauserella shujinwangii]PRX46924.1 hypothetical protein B0I33_10621 [Prauserella shujinwangii]
MSGFEVDTWGLDQLRKFFEQLAGHAESCQGYLKDNTVLDGGEGWLNDLSGSHDSITQQGADWFRDLAGSTLDPAAAAIKAAMGYYDATEAGSAAEFDGQIEGVSAPAPVETGPSSTGPGTNPTTFGIASDPEDSLETPPDYSGDENYKFDWNLTRYIGLTGSLRQMFIDVTGLLASIGWIDRSIDPYDAYAEPVLGDWAAMRRTADVYRNLANALDSFEVVLLHARVDLPEVWKGNAADACDAFLEELRSKLPGAAAEMRDVADIYQEASAGAADFRAVVDFVIDQIGDAIIIFAAAIAGGTVTATTGIGPVIGGAVALFEAHVISQGLAKLAEAKGIWDSIFGTTQSSMNNFGQISANDYYLPSLPQPAAEGSSLSHLPA